MNVGKFLATGLAAGAVILVIMNIVSQVMAMVFKYNVLELGGMRAVTDPIMILFFAYPFVLGFALTYAYSRITESLKGSEISKGLSFGVLMWIATSIPSTFLVWSSMNYPIGFTVSSVVGSLLFIPAAGVVIAKMPR